MESETASQPRSTFSRIMSAAMRFFFMLILVISLSINMYALAYIIIWGGAPNWATGLQETIMREGKAKDTVVVLPLNGGVDDGMEDFFNRAMDHIQKMKNPPKAMVLRVNSPGGSPWVSDRIYQRLKDYREARLKDDTNFKIIASFGDMAASGGYYVACGSDHIFAEPTTITGSVGVITYRLEPSQMLKNWGIQPYTDVADGSPHKSIGNDPFSYNEEDRAKVKMLLNAMYDRFAERVKEGRGSKMTEAQFAMATKGDAFMAERAVSDELKVVDEIGFLKDAIDYAGKEAKLDVSKMRVVKIKALSPSPLGLFIEENPGSIAAGQNAQQLPDLSGLNGEQLRALAESFFAPRIEARYYFSEGISHSN